MGLLRKVGGTVKGVVAGQLAVRIRRNQQGISGKASYTQQQLRRRTVASWEASLHERLPRIPKLVLKEAM
jgi:hypothetical protein